MKRVILYILLFIIFYVVSHGPFIFVLNHWPSKFLGKASRIIYYPMIMLSCHWESYYNYKMLWARAGGYKGDWTWEVERDYYLNHKPQKPN